MTIRPAASPAARLQELAAADPAVAPLARLHMVALRAVADPAWANGVPELDGRPGRDTPLLHGTTLTVDPARVRYLERAGRSFMAPGTS